MNIFYFNCEAHQLPKQIEDFINDNNKKLKNKLSCNEYYRYPNWEKLDIVVVNTRSFLIKVPTESYYLGNDEDD